MQLQKFKENIEDIVYDIRNKYTECIDFIRYRTTRKYHIIDTKLEPGYYDSDTRMLHANFSLLVDFVEIEKAWMNTWSDNNAYSKLSWFDKKFRRFRCPEDGIAYLNWEINESQLEHQAKAAKEVLELYTWWKVTRPNRQDPFDAAGYNEVFKGKHFIDQFIEEDGTKRLTMKPFSKKENQVFEKVSKIEAKYDKEDEQMLIRLIKIRQYLWT